MRFFVQVIPVPSLLEELQFQFRRILLFTRGYAAPMWCNKMKHRKALGDETSA
jgi:hypothetical protein